MAFNKNFDNKFKQLPPHIQDWMAVKSDQLNGEIADKHNLSLEEIGKMKRIIADTIVGIIKLSEFTEKLKKALSAFKEEELKNLALDILIKRLYPIRDHLQNVEALIKDLGGSLPQDKALYKEKFREENPQEAVKRTEKQGAQEDVTYIGIGNLLNREEIKAQFITSKKIHLKSSDKEVGGTFANWLQDYREKAGPPPHSSMERSDYLFKSDNTQKLDNSEKTILGEILKAYDQGTELPVSKESDKIVLSEVFHKGSADDQKVPQDKKKQDTKKTSSENTIDLRNSKQ